MLKTGCIILAGGKGRRLGREKAWVEIGGVSLLQRAVSNLEFLNSEIVIVKAPEGELPPVSACVNLKVVQDPVGGKGPLAGILSGLAASKYRYNMVLACDMPLVKRELIKYLVSLAPGFDAVILRQGPHLEPLLAVYSRDCIVEIENLLAQDKLKTDGLIGRVRTRFVETSDVERIDAGLESLFNVNTPADLKKAGAILGRS